MCALTVFFFLLPSKGDDIFAGVGVYKAPSGILWYNITYILYKNDIGLFTRRPDQDLTYQTDQLSLPKYGHKYDTNSKKKVRPDVRQQSDNNENNTAIIDVFFFIALSPAFFRLFI